MAVNRTCLSAGIVIRDILLADAEVKQIVTKVFPVVVTVEKAIRPYVVYRRTQMDAMPVKTGRPSDTTYIEVICYAESYDKSITLAEAVRKALDGKTYDKDDLHMRMCRMTDSEEGWENDAYMQQLIFEIKM